MDTRLLLMLRLTFGLLPIIAIGRQLIIHVNLGLSLVNFFSYFTNLANLLAATLLLVGAGAIRAANTSKSYETLRFVAASSMLVVGVVFSTLLRQVDLGSLLPWVNGLLHYIMPCVILADWLWRPPARVPGRGELLLLLASALLYLAYVLIRGAQTQWYPYPFLNPAHAGGYAGVAVYSLGIALIFLLGGWLLIWAARRRTRAKFGNQHSLH